MIAVKVMMIIIGSKDVSSDSTGISVILISM